MALLTVDEFATQVEQALAQGEVSPPPSPEHLREIILAAFYGSMESEEGRKVQFALAFLDEETLDLKGVGADVWSPSLFAEPQALTVPTIAKLAPTIDPTLSALAVTAGTAELRIVGIIRISRNEHRFSSNEVSTGRVMPWRCLVVKALATGHLRIDVGNDHVVSFIRGHVYQSDGPDVLGSGPVRGRLWEWARNNELDEFHYCDVIHKTLLSLLERGHGGVVIIQQGKDSGLFKGGFRIAKGGTDLQVAAQSLAGHEPPASRVEMSIYALNEGEEEHNQRLEREREERLVKRKLEIIHLAEDATDFAANLASRDGALVLGDDLKIIGFGVRIVAPSEPYPIVHAITHDAMQVSNESPIANLGTRHKSGADFAGHVPGSVVFVVSEDGVVSAMYRPQLDSPLHIWRPVALLHSWLFRSALEQTPTPNLPTDTRQ